MFYTEKSIIKVLAYFNVFNYPLNKEEIVRYLDAGQDGIYVEKSLDFLCRSAVIYKTGEFYSLQNDKRLIERRKKGNELARKQLSIAKKISRVLYFFPFVSGVAVSGSLSKNYADENSDIDFFIITKNNRLWMARTIMHLFKKFTFLAGRQHWFCMNYYIDESALEIREKNIFTAMEVATVLPLQGSAVFQHFFTANKWVKNFFPNHPRWQEKSSAIGSITPVNRKINSIDAGNRLNELLMRITEKRWKQKVNSKRRSYSGELMGLDTGVHYAKPDPANLQQKILYRYEKEMDAILTGLGSLKAV